MSKTNKKRGRPKKKTKQEKTEEEIIAENAEKSTDPDQITPREEDPENIDDIPNEAPAIEFYPEYEQREVLSDENKQDEPQLEHNETVSVGRRLQDIEEKIDLIADSKQKGKDKKFKLKFGIKKELKNLAKKQKVLVCLLGTNRSAKFITATVKDEMIWINGIMHQCTMDFVYLMDGKWPMVVLPEWSLVPIGTKDYYDKYDANTASAAAERIIIRAIESAEVMDKKKLSGKTIIWMLIGAAVVMYALFGQGV